MHLQFLFYDTIIVLKLLTFYYYRYRIGVVMVNYAVNIYERGCDIMGNKSKSKKEEKPNIKNNKRKKILEIVIVPISILFIGFISKLIWDFHVDFALLKENVSSIKEDVETIPEMSGDIKVLQGKEDSFETELNGFKNTINEAIVADPGKRLRKPISNATINTDDSMFLPTLELDNDINVATNTHTGRKYKPTDLRNKKILLPYSENGQDIYFYGQFNKYNHWDGKCILNVYKDNILNMIMEGVYNDGKLISYKQITHRENNNGDKVWSISERKINGNINTGGTHTYFKTKDKKSNFNTKNVEPNDILSIIDFKNWLDTPIEGYYCGNTSNGKYNDDTGQAYLIKYNKKGKIRLFYCGNFKDGCEEDSTGKAWDISLNEDNHKYYYRESHYSQDTINYDHMTYHENELSGSEAEERIKDKLGKKEFNNLKDKCEFIWDND